ncbi:MAG: 2-phospho-L-lactate transferase [Pseudomonadota bacterium]
MTLRVTLLAGGVGGAKMAEGFAALDDVALTVIGNVADDDMFHGLWVSPDIDTLTYTLAGLINRDQGWGLADEGRRALDMIDRLGSDTWMFLGDKDFGLHIYRSERRRRGDRPTVIAQDIARSLGVIPRILLPTDDTIQTRVQTGDGWLSFQEYFVREKCQPEVLALQYDRLDAARPTDEALSALLDTDMIVIAPSNPLVSILPIIRIPGVTDAIRRSPAPVVAVSPLIAGKVVKGPADRMLASLGQRADVVGVAQCYAGLADALVIDTVDAGLAEAVEATGARAICTDILMPDLAGKSRLAAEVVARGASLNPEGAV